MARFCEKTGPTHRPLNESYQRQSLCKLDRFLSAKNCPLLPKIPEVGKYFLVLRREGHFRTKSLETRAIKGKDYANLIVFWVHHTISIGEAVYLGYCSKTFKKVSRFQNVRKVISKNGEVCNTTHLCWLKDFGQLNSGYWSGTGSVAQKRKYWSIGSRRKNTGAIWTINVGAWPL